MLGPKRRQTSDRGKQSMGKGPSSRVRRRLLSPSSSQPSPSVLQMLRELVQSQSGVRYRWKVQMEEMRRQHTWEDKRVRGGTSHYERPQGRRKG